MDHYPSMESPVQEIVITKCEGIGLGMIIAQKTIGENKSGPIISKIKKDGALADYAHLEGMRILTINGVACRGMDDSVAILRAASPGKVRLWVGPLHFVAATVVKGNPDDPVGLVMRKDLANTAAGVLVAKAGRLFANSDLEVGMRLDSINGRQIGEDTTLLELTQVVQKSKQVTVIAEGKIDGQFPSLIPFYALKAGAEKPPQQLEPGDQNIMEVGAVQLPELDEKNINFAISKDTTLDELVEMIQNSKKADRQTRESDQLQQDDKTITISRADYEEILAQVQLLNDTISQLNAKVNSLVVKP